REENCREGLVGLALKGRVGPKAPKHPIRGGREFCSLSRLPSTSPARQPQRVAPVSSSWHLTLLGWCLVSSSSRASFLPLNQRPGSPSPF
ncbi:hypothetical protein B0T17DRAFT_491901, partial [Bombardia bombarda]